MACITLKQLEWFDIFLQNAESRIKQLEASLVERNEEISKLRRQHREEKQKTLDIEKRWRAQLESERQDTELRLDEQVRIRISSHLISSHLISSHLISSHLISSHLIFFTWYNSGKVVQRPRKQTSSSTNRT